MWVGVGLSGERASRSGYCEREKDNEEREREVKNVNFSNSSWPVTVFGDVQKSVSSFEKREI